MSARLKLGAQALAVGLVVRLLALLVWKLPGSDKAAADRQARAELLARPRRRARDARSSPRCAARRSC